MQNTNPKTTIKPKQNSTTENTIFKFDNKRAKPKSQAVAHP